MKFGKKVRWFWLNLIYGIIEIIQIEAHMLSKKVL